VGDKVGLGVWVGVGVGVGVLVAVGEGVKVADALGSIPAAWTMVRLWAVEVLAANRTTASRAPTSMTPRQPAAAFDELLVIQAYRHVPIHGQDYNRRQTAVKTA